MKCVLIDVRTKDEFDKGHLDNAINISHDEIANKISAITLDMNVNINLYCRSGNRSGIAADILKQIGYKNVKNLGSYYDLLNKKY